MFLLRKYNALITKRPLITKSLTGGVMFSLSDFLVQKHEQKELQKKDQTANPKYNFRRTGIACTMGTVFMMPFFHYWFSYGLPFLVSKMPIPNTPIAKAVTSMFFDQTIWAFSILNWYFLWVNILEHHSIDKGIKTIKENIFQTMLDNWKIWPAAQIINFRFIPIQYQVLWVNFIGFIWQIYLTFVVHK